MAEDKEQKKSERRNVAKVNKMKVNIVIHFVGLAVLAWKIPWSSNSFPVGGSASNGDTFMSQCPIKA